MQDLTLTKEEIEWIKNALLKEPDENRTLFEGLFMKLMYAWDRETNL